MQQKNTITEHSEDKNSMEKISSINKLYEHMRGFHIKLYCLR